MHSPFFPARRLSFARVRGSGPELEQFVARVRKNLANVRASHNRQISDNNPGPRYQLSHIEAKDPQGVETIGFIPFWNSNAWCLESYERIVFYIVEPFTTELFDEFSSAFCNHPHRRMTVQVDWSEKDEPLQDRLLINAERDQASEDADLYTSVAVWAIQIPRDERLRETMERVCQAWRLEELASIERNQSGFRIRPNEVGASSLRVEAWHQGVKASDPEPSYPSQIRLTGFEDPAKAVEYGRAAIACQPNPPSTLQFMLVALPRDVEQIVQVARTIRRFWNAWHFTAERRPGFNPYALGRTIRPGAVEAYPVIQLDNDYDQLLVRAVVVHTPDDTFLELQTSEGRQLLDKVADFGGRKIEIWEGPFEKRWGMYPAINP